MTRGVGGLKCRGSSVGAEALRAQPSTVAFVERASSARCNAHRERERERERERDGLGGGDGAGEREECAACLE